MALSLDSLLSTKISSAAKYQQTISEAASSVTIITAEDIQRHGYRSLPDALAATRGFYLSYDRNYSFLGARGLQPAERLQQPHPRPGERQRDQRGDLRRRPRGHRLGVPMRSLERIEIVRGPGSALYGTGAIFAVVNLVTKTADAHPGVQGSVRAGSYGDRGGSLGYRGTVGRDVGLSLVGTWDGTDGHDVFFPEFNSPEQNNGVAHHMDWERRASLLGSVTHGGLTLHGRYSSRTKAIPTGAYGTDLAGEASKTRDDYGFLELKLDRQLDASRSLSARTYLNTNRYDGDYITDGVNAPDGSRYAALGTEAALQWDVASSNRLTIGGEARRDLRARYFVTSELDWSLPNTVLSAYVQDEHQITRSLSILAGLRHDAYQRSVDATSPRLALIYSPSLATTFKLLYGTAFRAPSAYELSPGGFSYLQNENLRPETAETMEAVWQQRLAPGLLGSVSLVPL